MYGRAHASTVTQEDTVIKHPNSSRAVYCSLSDALSLRGSPSYPPMLPACAAAETLPQRVSHTANTATTHPHKTWIYCSPSDPLSLSLSLSDSASSNAASMRGRLLGPAAAAAFFASSAFRFTAAAALAAAAPCGKTKKTRTPQRRASATRRW